MEEKIEDIKNLAIKEIESVDSIKEIIEVKNKFIGKKSELYSIRKNLKELDETERKTVGKMVNDAFNLIQQKINTLIEELNQKDLDKKLQKEKIDITLPAKSFPLGAKHPLTQVLDRMIEIFISMGFSLETGPEIETDYYNFEALNIPKNHPARDTQDTFYISDNLLLRSQTSPVQIRVMEETTPPIKIISPGKVYRADAIDATHSPIFHQMEGLVVDKNVSMGDLKKTLEIFVKNFYKNNLSVRFRPHHFPFTEPSAEMDIACFKCLGAGCPLCKNEGFIEILGCGMVHPDVLKRCEINPEIYSGFAFGMGIERIAMLDWKINDLRLFYENDLRFLKQF